MLLETGATSRVESESDRRLTEYAQQQEIIQALLTRSRQVAYLFSISLALHAALPASAHADSQTLDASLAAQVDARPSTGSLKLKSGKVIPIPKAGERFPEVTVYSPKGRTPDKVILWFGQVHYHAAVTASPNESFRAEQYALLNASQEAAYHELKALHARGVITSACSESIRNQEEADSITAYNKTLIPITALRLVSEYLPHSEMAKVASRYDEIFEDKRVSSEELTELTTSIYPKITALGHQHRFALGAVEVLAAETKLRLCAGTTTQAYDAAWAPAIKALHAIPVAELSEAERALLDKVINADREVAAIETVAREAKPVAAVQYGDLHFPVPALIKWNQAHPRETLGLVIIRSAQPAE